jgi:PAS domain S-box-containing protein
MTDEAGSHPHDPLPQTPGQAPAEDEARDPEISLLRTLLDHSPDYIFFKDRQSRFITTNRAHARSLLGLESAEEAAGRTDFDFFPPEDAERFYREEQEIMESGRAVVAREWPVPSASGETRWVAEHKIPITGAGDQVVGLLGISRDVTDRVRAEAETRARTAQLEALRRLSLELTCQLDLHALLRTVVAQAVELLGGSFGELTLYRRGREVLETVAMVGDPAAVPGGVLRRGEGLAGRVWESGEPLVVDDYKNWEGRVVSGEIALGGTAGVPICCGEEFLGTLSVVSETPGAFGSGHAQLLSMLANQAAIAIHNARMYDEIRRRSLEQETTSRIARALNTLDVRTAFPVLAEGLRKLTGCDWMGIALPDEGGRHFVITTLTTRPRGLEPSSIMPLAASAAAPDILAGRYRLTADLSEETDFAAERALHEAGFRSRLSLPLLVAGQVVGALNLAGRRADHFHKEQVPALWQIAGALASALENSRLYRLEQRRRQEADTLREAAMALTTALDRDEVIQRILAQLQQVVPYDSSSVQLLWDDRLEIVGGRGFSNLPELLGVCFSIHDNPNQEVIRRRAPVIVADAPQAYPGFEREPHAPGRIRSWLGAPMLVGDRLIGIITLDKREPGFYQQQHARLAQAFAAQAAIAVENARLYEQARQDARTRARLLREVNHRVSNNLSAIMGLLSAERRHVKEADQSAYQALMQELSSRVHGLATVHAMLSASQWAPLRLSELAGQIIRSATQMLPLDKQLVVDITPSPVRVTADQAQTLALVINELATNSLKYAVPERRVVRITARIDLDGDTGQVRLEYHDDGPGYPGEVLRRERGNVGLELLHNLVRDSLRGDVQLRNDAGAVTTIHFKVKERDPQD